MVYGIYEYEFSSVLISQLVVSITMDGKWYTATTIRKRLRIERGVVTGTLSHLRQQGYLRRAKNPLNSGRPQHRTGEATYCYQWAGIIWENNAIDVKYGRPGNRERQIRYYQWQALPKAWREILG